MTVFTIILLAALVICAIATSFTKNLLSAILIYMTFGLVMSVLWMVLESPDLAITEAAVGAGVTSLLYFVTLKKLRRINLKKEGETAAEETQKGKLMELESEGADYE